MTAIQRRVPSGVRPIADMPHRGRVVGRSQNGSQATPVSARQSSMSLLDEIHQLREKYAQADRYERMVLDLAASLLELIQEETTGTPPERVTLWNRERYELLPDRFEMLSGRIHPKHWQLYEDSAAAESGPEEQLE